MATLAKMIGNLLKTDASYEERQKFRKVNLGNKAFHAKVGRLPFARDFFLVLGFTKPSKAEGELSGCAVQ